MATTKRLTRSEWADRAAEITAAVAGGTSPPEVAARFGVSLGIVYTSCSRNGLILRHNTKVGFRAAAAERRARVLEAAARGATYPEIMAKTGLTQDTIRRVCSRAGVALRPVVPRRTARALRDRQQIALRLESLAPDLDRRKLAILRMLGDVTLPIAQVGRKFDLSTGYLYAIVSKAKRKLGQLSRAGQLPPLLRDAPLPDPVAARLAAPYRPKRKPPRRRPVTSTAPKLAAPVLALRKARAAARLPTYTISSRVERRAQLAAAVVAGLSVPQAAAKFGVSPGLVYMALRESRLGTNAESPKAARRRAVLELARRGNPAETVAEQLGTTTVYVRSLCKRQGVTLQTRADRIEAARVHARHNSLARVDISKVLDGRGVRILRALRDTDLTLRQIATRCRVTSRKVFDTWTQALHRIEVPMGSSHDRFVRARRRVFASGISLRALYLRGGHHKLIQRMRTSNLTIAQMAHNARLSVAAVMRIWYMALDRSAIAAARLGPIKPGGSARRRRTKRERRVLRDLGL